MIRHKFSFSLTILVVIALFIRLIISTLPSFESDESAYRAWSQRLVENGPAKFYSSEVFTNNPLGGLYGFWAVGLIKNVFFPNLSFSSKEFDILLKIPANIADVISALIIYLIIKRSLNKKLAFLGFVLYIFNPALFFNSSVWGQYDGLSTLFLLVSTYLLLIKKSPELSIASFATAWTIKPQAIFFAPILFLFILLNFKFLRLLISTAIFFITVMTIYLPFFPKNPIGGLIYVNASSATLFECTSCFAFNFWGIFGNWNNDQQKFLSLSLLNWGIILLFLTLLVIFSKSIHQKLKFPFFYLTSAISIMAFFLILTRMHERYLFPFFPFLLLASLLLKSRALNFFYILLSALHFMNLLLPYLYYNNVFIPLANNLFKLFSVFSLCLVLSFLLLLKIYFSFKKQDV